MQQRYYDPSVGRFLSVDPVMSDDTGTNFNRYAYAANNPYRFIDPDGRLPSELACRLLNTCDYRPTDRDERFRETIRRAIAIRIRNEKNGSSGEGESEDEDYEPAPTEGTYAITDDYLPLPPVLSGARLTARAADKMQRKPGSHGQFKGRDGIRRENKQPRDAAKAAGLNKAQSGILHDMISGQGFSYKQIVEIAKALKGVAK